MADIPPPQLIASAPPELSRLADRFWAHVERPSQDGCWPFQGDRQHRVRFSTPDGSRHCLGAAVVAYRLAVGVVDPQGRVRCRLGAPGCCTPHHLDRLNVLSLPAVPKTPTVAPAINFHLLRLVSEHLGLSHVELRLYVCLVGHMNDKGMAWPSQVTLSREAGCAVSMVGTATRTLELKRLLIRMEGRRHQTYYRLLDPAGALELLGVGRSVEDHRSSVGRQPMTGGKTSTHRLESNR